MTQQRQLIASQFIDAKMCFASLKHLTFKDTELLKEVCSKGVFDNIVAYPHCYGFFIYLDDCLHGNEEGFAPSLRKSGYSREFIRLMKDAKAAGFNHMKLDDTQPAHEGRRVFS